MDWSSRAQDGAAWIPGSPSNRCFVSAFPPPTAQHSISKRICSSFWLHAMDWLLRTSDASSALEANDSGSLALIPSGLDILSPPNGFPTAEASNLPPKTSPCSCELRASPDVVHLFRNLATLAASC